MNTSISTIRMNGTYTNYNRDMIRKRKNLRMKRIQELKQKIAFLVLSIILILIVSLIFGTIRTNATTQETAIRQYKYFTSYTVKYHDTLWEIAPAYMDGHYDSIEDYIAEVERMNHIDADKIKAGTTIMLPYYSDEYLE